MNLKEALDTANWLLERESLAESDPNQILRIRKMRDSIYLMYAAAGIPEIILQMMEEYPGQLGS